MIGQAESKGIFILPVQKKKTKKPATTLLLTQLLYFLYFFKNVFLCVLVHEYASWCISEIESGRRIPRTRELGLVFCLITQWQARGCPVCLHANGPRACARLARITSVASKGQSMTHHIRAAEHMYPEARKPHGFSLKKYHYSLCRRLLWSELWYILWGDTHPWKYWNIFSIFQVNKFK